MGYPDYNKINKGNGDLDVRYRWASGFVLDAPLGRGQHFATNVNRVVNQFVAGWQIAGIFTVESGQWFTPSQEFDTGNNGNRAYCGNYRTRPDYVPSQDSNAGPHKLNPADVTVKWFNVNAFRAAANGTIWQRRPQHDSGTRLWQFGGCDRQELSHFEKRARKVSGGLTTYGKVVPFLATRARVGERRSEDGFQLFSERKKILKQEWLL